MAPTLCVLDLITSDVGSPYRRPTRLAHKFDAVRGPFPIGLGQVLAAAEELGAETARAGIELFLQYVAHTTAGIDLLGPEAWPAQ